MLTTAVLRKRKHALANRLVERQRSAIGGDGLFAATEFRAGEPLASYDGEWINAEESQRRFAAGDPVALYHQGFRGGYIVPDVSSLGGHLANHSCAPNSFVRGTSYHERPVMVAMSDIAAGDEITQWYGWVHEEPIACRCGAGVCLGTIGWKSGALSPADVDRIVTAATRNSNWAMLESLIAPNPDPLLNYMATAHPKALVWYQECLVRVANLMGLDPMVEFPSAMVDPHLIRAVLARKPQ